MSKQIRYNKSKTYLLPLLSELVQFNPMYFSNLKNTYIYDDLSKYKNCIYLLNETNIRNPQFTNYENKLLNNTYFVDLIDVDTNYSVYIFDFPDEYLHEYNMFVQGKYSHFGDDAKKLVLSFWGEIYQNNVNAVNFLLKVKQILYRDDKLRRQLEKDLGPEVKIPETAELTDRINSDDETFELSKYLIIK